MGKQGKFGVHVTAQQQPCIMHTYDGHCNSSLHPALQRGRSTSTNCPLLFFRFWSYFSICTSGIDVAVILHGLVHAHVDVDFTANSQELSIWSKTLAESLYLMYNTRYEQWFLLDCAIWYRVSIQRLRLSGSCNTAHLQETTTHNSFVFRLNYRVTWSTSETQATLRFAITC